MLLEKQRVFRANLFNRVLSVRWFRFIFVRGAKELLYYYHDILPIWVDKIYK